MQIKVRLDSRPIQRWAKLFSKQTLLRAARVVGPTLVALTFAGVAHAQGTMDFSGAQTLMGTFKTFAIYAGAVICFGGLIFAGIRMMSGRFQDAIPGLFGALFGAGVLGWGARLDTDLAQRQQQLAAAMQQLQAAQETRGPEAAGAPLWLLEGALIADVIAMLQVRRNFELPAAICSARAREIATTAARMIARKKIA